jgi:uncharacterized protein YkwD
MTPRQRSFVISTTALVLAGAGVYLGAGSLAGPGNDLFGNGSGQHIENVAGPITDELSVSSSTTALAEVDAAIEGIQLSPPAELVPPSGDVPTTTSTTSGSSETIAAETTAPATDPPTTPESTGATPPSEETVPDPTSSSTTETTATSTTPTEAPAGLNAAEQEIFRLTNELRANPSGPLARQKAMPPCVDDDFYGINIDAATGHPTAVPALTLSEPVSLEMSRPWAIDMDQRNTMSHRPNDSQLAIYGQLGIDVSAIGENVAWFQGYPDSEAARIHFEGWRESDTGHYCALVSGTYTHLGVGHYRGATKSWAVQNYYQPR